MLLVAAAAGGGLAQVPSPEKHVKEIRAMQPTDVKPMSPLCQLPSDDPVPTVHIHKADAAKFEPDLKSLMEKSEEVVLSNGPLDNISVLSIGRFSNCVFRCDRAALLEGVA
jgi:hypothetical protein